MTSQGQSKSGPLNKADLDNWITNQLKVKYNLKTTSIRESKLGGGLGLFYTHNTETTGTGTGTGTEDIELLRISGSSTFNIYRCLELLERLEHDDQKVKATTLKKCLEKYVSDVGASNGITETTILTGYIIGFYILWKIGEFENDGSESTKNNIDAAGQKIASQQGPDDKTWSWDFLVNYLRVLANTDVHNVHNDDVEVLKMYNDQLSKENPLWDLAYWEATKGLAEFTSWVNDELIVGDDEKDKNVKIQPDELLQIVSAVRSRTLEIPRAAGKSEEGEKKDESKEED
ncbi:unnamed protein product [Ambrosiozyma monospora]|uniref:Unnamed protein product n=1 Tax=Ambrosiozyma monospora TaxID=43982 RepID=A0ACB5U6A5_AMBMO|nr:unnamed protein product [Ambrosiozyma monospora]